MGAAHKVHIVPFLFTVLGRLLDGAEDQVTPLLRRKTYGALAHAVRHHLIRGDGCLDHVADMAFRGMTDKDRSVRLSAGYGRSFLIHSLLINFSLDTLWLPS